MEAKPSLSLGAIIVGLFAGVVIGLGSFSVSVAPALAETTSVFKEMPNVTAPFVVRYLPQSLIVSGPISSILKYGLLIMVAAIGMLNTLVVKPQSQTGALGAGIISGLVISIILFPLSMGWLTTYKMSQEPSDADIYLLAKAAFEQQNMKHEAARHALRHRYPDIMTLSNARKGDVRSRKIRAQQLATIPDGLLSGLLSILAIGFVPCAFGTVFAYHALDKYGSFAKAMPTYMQGAVTLSFLSLFSMLTTVGRWTGTAPKFAHWWLFCLFVVSAVVALISTINTWRLPARIGLHLLWLTLLFVMVSRVTVAHSQLEMVTLLQQENFTGTINLLTRQLEDEPLLLNERITLCVLLAHEEREDEWKHQVAELNRHYGHVIEPAIMRWHGLVGLLHDDPQTKWRAIGYAKWAIANPNTHPTHRAWSHIASSLGAVRNNNVKWVNQRLDKIEWADGPEMVYGMAVDKVIRMMALNDSDIKRRQKLNNELDEWILKNSDSFAYKTASKPHLLLVFRTLQREVQQTHK